MTVELAAECTAIYKIRPDQKDGGGVARYKIITARRIGGKAGGSKYRRKIAEKAMGYLYSSKAYISIKR
jgi:hypothetical protein